MTLAPERRWFRWSFSLRALFVLTAVAAAVTWRLLPNDLRDIQGTWRGTGRDARYSLTFRGRDMLGKVGTDPVIKPTVAHFELSQKQGTIDILRADGVQRGLYKLEGGTLTMMLADVGLPRPASIDFPPRKPSGRSQAFDRKHWTPPTLGRYVFERADD